MPRSLFRVAFGMAVVTVLAGVSPGQTPVAQPPPSKEDFVGPPDPRLERPPRLALDPSAPDPSAIVDQTLEALLGRTSKEYILPSPETVIRAIFGFVFLLTLAYLAGHPRVAEIERKLGVAHLATTGFPFVLLGLVAAQPEFAVLSPAVLVEIGPLLTFGLGWIGLGVGLRFNAEFRDRLPAGSASVLGYTAVLPFVAVSMICAFVLRILTDGEPGPTLVRDALLLGAAGALSARSAPHLWLGRGFAGDDIDRMQTIVQMERLAGVTALMVIASYFRPSGTVVAWQLPGAAWLFLTVGVGFALGGVFLAILSSTREQSESLPLFLGGIAFAAGMASYLRLSALAVCFLVGVLLAAFPGPWTDSINSWIRRLERPIYFLFLTIAGALWRPGDWRGWALMAVFVGVRLSAKWTGAALLAKRRSYPEAAREREWLTFAPLGAISIAIVVNAQSLFSGPQISWIVTSVIMGSLASEAIVQAVLRRPQSAS